MVITRQRENSLKSMIIQNIKVVYHTFFIDCLQNEVCFQYCSINSIDLDIGKPTDFQQIYHIEVDPLNPYGNSWSLYLFIGLTGIPQDWLDYLEKHDDILQHISKTKAKPINLLDYVSKERCGCDINDLSNFSEEEKQSTDFHSYHDFRIFNITRRSNGSIFNY